MYVVRGRNAPDQPAENEQLILLRLSGASSTGCVRSDVRRVRPDNTAWKFLLAGASEGDREPGMPEPVPFTVVRNLRRMAMFTRS